MCASIEKKLDINRFKQTLLPKLLFPPAPHLKLVSCHKLRK